MKTVKECQHFSVSLPSSLIAKCTKKFLAKLNKLITQRTLLMSNVNAQVIGC